MSSINQDIIENHILPQLDGMSLISLSCASSHFYSLSTQDTLWRDICTSTWPSIKHQRASQLISTFSNGHRSLFSDCLPLLTVHDQSRIANRFSLPPEIMSAVDVKYKNRPIFSRILETQTGSGWFHCSPFRLDLVDPKEVLPTGIEVVDSDADLWKKELEENLTLSWIIIDPTRKKSANFSSIKLVSMERHWLTGDVQAEFATVLGCARDGFVECKVHVVFGGREEKELHIKEVFMLMEDKDKKYLNGKDSLIALVHAIECGKRKRIEDVNEGKRRYEEYLKRKKSKRNRKVMGKRMWDMACVTGFCILAPFTASFVW